MNIETLKKGHKKEIIIGISLFVILAITLVVRLTFAKYNLVKSIKIAEGTINYKVPDYKMMAMYKNDGNGDIAIDTIPESGYAINESKSYCSLDNVNKDTKAKLYTNADGNHIISGLSKGSKCYLYFDNYRKVNTSLGEITVKLATPDFSKTSCTSGCEETTVGIYQAKDEDGMSYYYRGDVENNYVKFANKWWRIIRINGDGSIRLIYDGTSAHQNGEVTTDSIAVSGQAFNLKANDNAYVGFKYTLGEVHGLGTKSNALAQLETWYVNNLKSYEAKIDINAGFCGDRTSYTYDSSGNYIEGGGTGTIYTVYGPYFRVRKEKKPIMSCPNMEDLYTTSTSIKGNKSLTYPIGLISADETVIAGNAGFSNSNNRVYYLYNGQSYWTISPDGISNNQVYMFIVNGNGSISISGANSGVEALRPVINLRSDVKLTGKGTISNPYVVN